MAKKSKEGFGAEIDNIFADIDKINPEAAFLNNSTLSKVDSWIDTGCYALNVICSGSLYKGVPSGRITGFVGPSATGKSFIINKIIGNAQKKGRFAVGFDTEVAIDEGSVINVGGDPTRFKHVPIETIGEARNQMNRFLTNVNNSGQKSKFIMSIDSLGNLISTKEKADILAGKDAMDMGARAREMKSFIRSITYPVARADIPVLFSNHVYDDPSAMFDSMVKNQSGGKAIQYLASLAVQLSVTQEKSGATGSNVNRDATEDVSPIARKGVNGVTIRALTIKNRFAPPFLEAELYLNFTTGLEKYSGLLDMAVGYGAIIQTGTTYTLLDGKKLGFYKQWRQDETLWEETILPELEKQLQAKLKFNNATEPEEIETEEEETADEP